VLSSSGLILSNPMRFLSYPYVDCGWVVFLDSSLPVPACWFPVATVGAREADGNQRLAWELQPLERCNKAKCWFLADLQGSLNGL
jgi:hypothetical protein